MRILFVIAALGRGGAERLVLRLARDRAERGDVVGVASSGGVWESCARDLGAQVYRIDGSARGPMETLAVARQLRRITRDFKPDVIHTHQMAVTAALRVSQILARRAGILTTLHSIAPRNPNLVALTLRLSSPRVIACSFGVRDELRATRFPSSRVAVIRNSARLDEPHPAAVARAAACLMRGRPVVVGLGRLIPAKGWDILVEAATEVKGADFVVFGDGELRVALENQAAKLRAPVRFLPAVDDVNAILKVATCIVSSARSEGLPLALLEAASLGVPIVAPDLPGIREKLAGASLLFTPGDPGALAHALMRCLGDSGLRNGLGAGGRSAVDEADEQRMLEGYDEAYHGAAALSY